MSGPGRKLDIVDVILSWIVAHKLRGSPNDQRPPPPVLRSSTAEGGGTRSGGNSRGGSFLNRPTAQRDDSSLQRTGYFRELPFLKMIKSIHVKSTAKNIMTKRPGTGTCSTD